MGTAFTIAGLAYEFEPEEPWESFHLEDAAMIAASIGLYPPDIGSMRARGMLGRIDALLSHTPEQPLRSCLERLRRVVIAAGELGVIRWS